MKFTLTNTGRINRLVERFVLLEATQAEVQGYCDEIIDIIKPLLKDESNDSSNSIQNNKVIRSLITEVDRFSKDISTSASGKKANDPAIIKGYALNFKNAYEKLLSQLDPKLDKSKIDAAFKPIKDLIASSDYSKENIKKLRTNVDLLKQALDLLLKSISNKSINDTTVHKGEIIGNLKAIYADLLKVKGLSDAEYTDEFGTGVSAVYQAAKRYDADKTDQKLADFVNVCKAQHTGTFGKRLAEIQGDKSDEVRQEVAGSTDWDTKYEKAQNKEAFWNDYFDTVWGRELGKKVAALGQAFKQECEVFGFDSMANPFIRYLEKYLRDEKFDITKKPYNAIHNAVVNGRQLNKNRLLADSFPIQDGKNWDLSPIHKADFFKKSDNDIEVYLDAMAELRNITTSKISEWLLKANSITDPTIQKAFKQFLTNADAAEKLVYAILYADKYDANTLISKNQKIDIADLKGAKTLRPGAHVKKLIGLLDAVNESAGKNWSPTATSALTKDLWAKFPISTPATASDLPKQQLIANYILVIAESYLSGAEYGKLLKDTKYKVDGKTLDSISPSSTVRAQIKIELAKYGATMSTTEAWNLIDELAKKWEIKK